MAKTKKESAEKFLADLKAMDSDGLQKLIDAETDPALVTFLRDYAAAVILNNLQQPLQAAATLIMIGYLMRANEEQTTIWLSPKGDA